MLLRQQSSGRERERARRPFAHDVLDLYRSRFKPSAQLDRAHVMLGVNVFAADTDAEGRRLFTSLQQAFVNLRRGHPGNLPPPDPGVIERLLPGDRRLLVTPAWCIGRYGGPREPELRVSRL